jgi:cell wall-associated NlpC family hydrolase
MGQLANAARGYIGTRFRHRGRSAVGVDCAGLGVLAYRDCGVELPDYTLYGREPYRDGLVQYITQALGEPVWQAGQSAYSAHSALRDDDVIVMRFDREPHHVGIVAAATYGGTQAFNIVHADGNVGRVIEQRLAPDTINRITHVFRKAVD